MKATLVLFSFASLTAALVPKYIIPHPGDLPEPLSRLDGTDNSMSKTGSAGTSDVILEDSSREHDARLPAGQGTELVPRWPPTRFPCPAEACWRICIRPWATHNKGKNPREHIGGKCKAKCARHCHEPLEWDGDRTWPNLEKELEE
ncbi:hypothetical protein GQ53DRAFT_878961 [Thozetella sp. PMI_491]|nr:hypothetical protein GQ53DRAFT_878961 [Thozetella sp. PMI_491]